MIKNPKINVYINAAKSYYYPGETFSATILLDVKDTVNCNKMTVIAKGKQIINASQTNKFANEEKPLQYESSSSSSSDEDDEIPRLKRANMDDGPLVTINEKKKIFKKEIEKEIGENLVKDVINLLDKYCDKDLVQFDRKLMEDKIKELKNKGYDENKLEKVKDKLDEIFAILMKEKIFI